MMTLENEGDRLEEISQEEELNKVARAMAEDLGLRLNPSKNRLCPFCGQIVKNRNWLVHQEGHRIHDSRRRGER